MATLISPPLTEHRPARPCAVIRSRVTMAQLSTDLPPLGEEVVTWLARRGIEPAGPFFWRYREIDMAALLTVDVGVPVAKPFTGDARVLSDSLPEGTYAVTRHRGHPDGLEAATGEFLDWGAAQGVAWDKAAAGPGERWGCRLEWYLEEPEDMSQWVTELAFMLK